MTIDDLLRKSQNRERFTTEELETMLTFPPDSPESYRMMAEARRISKELTGNLAEIHGQFSLNLSPCGAGCKFCSFASVNKIFETSSEISPEEAVRKALAFENEGANAVFLMTTAHYSFSKFIEISKEIRNHLKPETPLIANVGDKTAEEARKMKDTGFRGVYHALRLREGTDTGLEPEKRKKSIRTFLEAGLLVGTCVEPVGPEHTNKEIAEMIAFTGSHPFAYSGSARRITIPGGALAQKGMISELRMAQIVAVTRMGVPGEIKGNCTHEPCTLGAMAGASLFWAETGANPRDVKEHTEEGRGGSLAHCRKIYQESGWEVRKGPSLYYADGTGDGLESAL
ncbi:MAG: radical SAM protein [Desulfococcaceae bacterium]|jgi:biotin synthase|nr:radical SAM protein [Desulfococcaceae bacterium]